MEESARRIDGSKIGDETAAVAVTAVVQTGLVGNGNDIGSVRRRELGVNIAA